jgi:hypothetical protein
VIGRRFTLLLAVGVAVLTPTAFAAGATPAVRITSMRPVTVAGRGFVAAERVRVVLYLRRARVENVVANRRGRFVAHYPVAVGNCTPLRVVAKGNRGSRASYSIIPDCAAPRSDGEPVDGLLR